MRFFPQEKKSLYSFLTSGIVELCLNRPEARNALSKVLVEEILTQVELISSSEDVRCVLFRSHVQGIFCAGKYLLKIVLCKH